MVGQPDIVVGGRVGVIVGARRRGSDRSAVSTLGRAKGQLNPPTRTLSHSYSAAIGALITIRVPRSSQVPGDRTQALLKTILRLSGWCHPWAVGVPRSDHCGQSWIPGGVDPSRP